MFPSFCTGTTRLGQPCRFAARRQSGLCINHDPDYREQQRANVRRATEASLAARRHAEQPIAIEGFDLTSHEGIQTALATVVTAEFNGHITNTQARNLIRALAIALRNYEKATAYSEARNQWTHNRATIQSLRHEFPRGRY